MRSTSTARVAFVTTADTAILHDDFDLPFQIAAFADAGIELMHIPWERSDARWEEFDLVIVRSPWNYVDRLDEFMQWLDARRGLPTMVNPAEVIAWNIDKRHLAELAGLGVSVVPTRYATSIDELQDALASVRSPQVILKPTISAGSRLTGRFVEGSPGAVALGERILAAGHEVMVQPFAGSVEHVGEVGTVCFDGVISHSFCKGPLLGEEGELRGGEYREEISHAELDDATRELVLRTQDAVVGIARDRGWLGADEQLLYGRYDIVTLDDGSPALLEAEVFEPSLFLMVDEAAPARFVAAVRARL